MSAIIWFLISMVLCVVGAYVAVFAVTTRKAMNAWVSVTFLMGAVGNLLFIAIITMKS